MLTAKIGNSIINCIDCKYDRYILKQWSNKEILKCPVCNESYEYCHGEIVTPYFRHIEKECDGFYSEPETDEHKNGKILLFNWIKDQKGIENCKLEAWIPETKQRPDIYFEYYGKPFVIEFQCTPIASEFLIRRELYRLNGITDIWLIGTENFNIQSIKSLGKGRFTGNHSSRLKQIEKECSNNNGLVYLDVKNNCFIFHSSYMKFHFNLKEPYEFYGFDLSKTTFSEGAILVCKDSLRHLRNRDIDKIRRY